MKTKAPHPLVQLHPLAAPGGTAPILARAISLARGRKQIRTTTANRMVNAGWKSYRHPLPESWRYSLARYLRRAFRRAGLNLWIYRGGHHLAIMQDQRTLAQISETVPL